MKVFMIMPYNDEISNDIYEKCIKRICENFDLEIYRADDIFTPTPIIKDIINEIGNANVIIVDISGNNSNVFYELGMAHILKSEQTIIITRDDFNIVPFDISHLRIIQYENTIRGKEDFEKKLNSMLEGILKNYRLVYKDEYKLVFNILNSYRYVDNLIALLAIIKYDDLILIDEPIAVEGVYKKEENKPFAFVNMFLESLIAPFINIGYVFLQGDLVFLTEKGRVFSEILEDEYELYVINDKIIKEGYEPTIINDYNEILEMKERFKYKLEKD